MGFFTSNKDHKLAYFEKSSIEKKFLNLHLFSKNKTIEFISRDESEVNTSDILRYYYLIKKKKICFTICKATTFNDEDFESKYNSFGSYLRTGEYYEGKLNNDKDSYIGLPKHKVEKYPYIILEFESTIMDYKTNKSHLKLNEYLTLDNLANGWRKEVERDFNIISDKIIKETLKYIK